MRYLIPSRPSSAARRSASGTPTPSGFVPAPSSSPAARHEEQEVAKRPITAAHTLARRSTRHLGHRLACVVLPAGLGLILLTLLLTVARATAEPLGPASTGQGSVVVQFGDHDLIARSISFTAPISGLRALELTGLDVVTATTGFGPAVCSIEGVGCPASDCFCGGSNFWNYNYWDGSTWQGYAVGAGDSAVGDGGVEGWRWGSWGSSMQPARPVTAALQALSWLRTPQSLSDGGYGGDGSTAEAAMAIGANGYRAGAWRRQPGAPSLLSYQMAYAARYASQGAAQAGKQAVGLVATGACWPRGTRQPSTYYNAADGTYSTGALAQAWAILGSAALSQTVPAAAQTYLENLAQPNGGWEWAPGMGTDSNSTALALQALVAAGEPLNSPVISNGLNFLRSAQNADGGFTYTPGSSSGTASDADSTAYSIQALIATGQDPASGTWSQGGNTPISYLLSLQLPDGSFEWQKGSGANQLATEQAVPALLGRAFPLRVMQPVSCQSIYLPTTIR